jgi:hypothetical protein
LAAAITPHLMAMRGTERRPVRCAALRGDISRQVACTLYEQRSSACREFALGEPRSDEVRRRHGLAPLGAQALAWRETVACARVRQSVVLPAASANLKIWRPQLDKNFRPQTGLYNACRRWCGAISVDIRDCCACC